MWNGCSAPSRQISSPISVTVPASRDGGGLSVFLLESLFLSRFAVPLLPGPLFQIEYLEAMVRALSLLCGPKAVRDRALLLIGFFGAFRRSELVGVKVDDLAWETEGVVIRIPRSKTDQAGQGRYKALLATGGALCPVMALKAWLACSAIEQEQGPVFRRVTRWGEVLTEDLHPSSGNAILKDSAARAGLDFAPELSSHSLRRSLATGAHRAGASFESIKRQGGWRHDGTVREYIDEAQRFEDNAAAVLMAKAHVA